MSEIPEDIKREASIWANGVIPTMCMTWDHSFGLMEQPGRDALLRRFSQVADNDIRPIIAQAILAERNRCAKIAEKYGDNISYGKYMNTAAAEETAINIAAAIRGVRND